MVTTKELRDMMSDAIAIGIHIADKQRYPARDLISQSEAYRRFGQVNVQRWRDNGLLHPQRTGPHANNSVRYSVTEISAAIAAEGVQKSVNSPGAFEAYQEAKKQKEKVGWQPHTRSWMSIAVDMEHFVISDASRTNEWERWFDSTHGHKIFHIWFFIIEQRAQVEKQPQLVYKTITYATQWCAT